MSFIFSIEHLKVSMGVCLCKNLLPKVAGFIRATLMSNTVSETDNKVILGYTPTNDAGLLSEIKPRMRFWSRK